MCMCQAVHRQNNQNLLRFNFYWNLLTMSRGYMICYEFAHTGWKSSCCAIWRNNNDVAGDTGQVWRAVHYHPRPHSGRGIYGNVWYDNCCRHFQPSVCGPEFLEKPLYPGFLTGIWNGTSLLAFSRGKQERHTNRFISTNHCISGILVILIVNDFITF